LNLKKWQEFFFKTNTPNALNKDIVSAYNATRDSAQVQHLCHAPYKSMLFSNNGRVLACCFNRQAISGTYPQQNLKEIWFGKEAEKLREHIACKDLSYGCFVCKAQLRNKEFNTVKARMFDHLPASSSGYPVMMEFDLDNTCNLECVMCNADNSSAIRSKSELYGVYKSPYNETLLDELEPFISHLHQASFAGGEPFLIKLYSDIWEKMIAINSKMRINITTNGTVLTEKIKAILESGFFEISVSLDTIKKEIYSEIRKNANFEKVMENLFYFHDYCQSKGTFFGVWACPLRNNKYEIPELFNYFGAHDIEVYLHTVWVPPKVALWNLSSQELNELHTFYDTQELEEDTEVKFKNKLRFKEYVSLIKAWEMMALMRERRTPQPKEYTKVEDYLLLCLKRQYHQKEFRNKGINAKVKECQGKLLYCQKNLPPPIYNEAVEALSQYPDEFIFQIFEAGTETMICDFFKFLTKS